MKKMSCFLAVIIALFFLLGIPAFADGDETETVVEEETTEDVAEETTEAEPAVAGEPTNFVNQVWAWFVENKNTIISTITSGICAILLFLFRNALTKTRTAVDKRLDDLQGTSNSTSQSQSAVVSALNNMIEEYNKLQVETSCLEDAVGSQKEEYAKLVKELNDVIITTNAILEMLQTAYSNSKSLPQPVKDLLAHKYVKAIESIDTKEEV